MEKNIIQPCDIAHINDYFKSTYGREAYISYLEKVGYYNKLVSELQQIGEEITKGSFNTKIELFSILGDKFNLKAKVDFMYVCDIIMKLIEEYDENWSIPFSSLQFFYTVNQHMFTQHFALYVLTKFIGEDCIAERFIYKKPELVLKKIFTDKEIFKIWKDKKGKKQYEIYN